MSTTIGIFVLGILCGWLLEWLFVSFFRGKVPITEQLSPIIEDHTANTSTDHDFALLQQQNQQLQTALAAAKHTISELETSLQQTQTFLSEHPPIPASPIAETQPATLPTVTLTDDLTRLKGIGPRLEQIMHEAGIITYAQLTRMTGKELAATLEPSGILFSRAIVDSWPIQAKLAAEGKWEELRKYKSNLKA